jgi:outer membrane protein assembly factor BamB
MTRWLSTALIALTATTLTAADWPAFRGPNADGHYVGKPLVTEWGVNRNVTWKTPLPGKGWSTPIAVGDRLIVTTAVPAGSDYSLRALALSQKTGAILWDKELFVEKTADVPQPHKKNSHASPSPVSDGKQVWVHFGHMGTACLGLDGNVLWKTQELKYDPLHGNGDSPILVDDLLVFNCDGKDVAFVAALDKATGQVRWKTPRKTGARMTFSFATCLLIEHAGRRMIVSPAADFCMGYDPKSGAELWRVKYPQPGWSLIAQPVTTKGLVVIATGYTNQHLIAFRPDGTGDITPQIVWDMKRNAPNTPTPIAVGDELYVLSDAGFLTCMDALSGKVHYAERLAGRAYSASPILADGKLYFTSELGVGQVIAVGKEFREVSRSELDEKTFASPVPVDGALYLRTESQLYRFDRQ